MSFSNIKIFREPGSGIKQNLSRPALICIGTMLMIYTARFSVFANLYVFIVSLTLSFLLFQMSSVFAVNEANLFIERIALKSNGQADHVRNLSQITASISRLGGILMMTLLGSLNYWRNVSYQIGKHIKFNA